MGLFGKKKKEEEKTAKKIKVPGIDNEEETSAPNTIRINITYDIPKEFIKAIKTIKMIEKAQEGMHDTAKTIMKEEIKRIADESLNPTYRGIERKIYRKIYNEWKE